MDKHLTAMKVKEKLEFPGKILFSNFKDKNIQVRKQKLELYLNRLASVVNLLELPVACEFFDIEQNFPVSGLPNYELLHSDVRPGPESDRTSCNSATPAKRKEAILVHDFLDKLNSEGHSVPAVVEDFEKEYFSTLPHFIHEEIKDLLWGDSKRKGLLLCCGNVHNSLASASCLQLLMKLLTYEYSFVEADKFLAVFGATEPALLKQMQLCFSILKHQSSQDVGHIILSHYLHRNTHAVTQVEALLDDAKAIEEFRKFEKSKAEIGTVYYVYCLVLAASVDHQQIEENKELVVPKIKDKITEEILKESLGTEKITKLLVESSNLTSLNDMKGLLDQLESLAAWKPIEGGNANLQAFTRGSKNIRFITRLNTPNYKLAARYLFEPERVAQWRPLYWRILKKDSPFQDILQVVREAPLKKTQYIEYLLFRNIGKGADGKSILIVERSLILPPSCVSFFKRVHINASVCRVSLAADAGSQPYTKCEVLIRAEEGYDNLVEYIQISKHELELHIQTLNKLLQPTAVC